LRGFWTIFHRLYIPVGIGNISCSKMSVCSSSLRITSYSICYPLTRGPIHMSRPNFCLSQVLFHPSRWMTSPGARIRARVAARAFCFVRNGYSIVIPTSGTIFELLLKNRAAFIENHFENRFQTKQASPPHLRNRISEQLVAWIRG
jgi:hypothetical protein